MKEDRHESKKSFSISMTSFSYQYTFKQNEDRELVSEVNYITVAVLDSDVKDFAVSFWLFLSSFLCKQTYCDIRMVDWKIILTLWFFLWD